MRLDAFTATDVLPIRRFAVTDLADIVVLAGANGVGKTRLIDGLVSLFRSPSGYRQIQAVIRATNAAEQAAWGKDSLNTADQEDARRLSSVLQQTRRRSSWTSSVLQFESDRSIQQIQPYSFSWDFSDPFAEATGWDMTFGGLRSRLQDTLHSLFRKVRSHREEIARNVELLRQQGAQTMPLDWPDPLASFKTAFSQLLAPKHLLDPNPQQQQLEYELDGQRLPVSSLSSGEREVVNVVFDFLLRNPSDCIVFFDEPELHLHPELSYRLLQTLRSAGVNNQFVFCTQSPDIITASLDQSVVFVGPAKTPPENQAIPVRPDDETNQALRLLGQSVGIVALGKRIVLVEGTEASLDKQTYGSILRDRHPELVLVPASGRGLVTSFDRLFSDVLERSIWGVEFFMLCDRDALPPTTAPLDIEARANGRLRVLPRYHLENYFLDETVLAAVFAEMEPATSWLRDPTQIRARLLDIAHQHSSTAVALIVAAEIRSKVGNVDIMPKGVHGQSTDDLVSRFLASTTSETARVTAALDRPTIESVVRATDARVRGTLAAPANDEWKVLIPGRPVLNTFAQQTGLGPARLKQLYIRRATEQSSSCFGDLYEIFGKFAGLERGAA